MPKTFINIPLGNRMFLKSDSMNFYIAQDNNGKEDILSYHSNIESALYSYSKRIIKTCGAKTFNDLIKAIESLEQMISQLELKQNN